MVIGALIFFLVFLIVFLYSRIKVFGSITLNQEKQVIWVACYFYRIRLLERSIDLTEEEPEHEKSFQETVSLLHKGSQNIIQKARISHEIVTLILERLRFHDFSWQTEVGTGKAHTTGMAVGGIWSAKGAVAGMLSAKSHFHCRPSMTVTPVYNQKRIHSAINCMISIRTGQAIYALLKIIRKYSVKQEAII
ncbi:DUF2953 domain-containing protein [Lentibacillus jeotgali]|uniref:DUF2953 domain-containing protein n=1 Tax=Lentibacillus jeotgali TaxID=558169 RepID=UPI000262808C|nr:DUF2953 domain-containing protein [Lentibacillus jeotgali]